MSAFDRNLVEDSVIKGGLSVELGLLYYIFYRGFQSRDSPSINAIISHLPCLAKYVISLEKLSTR